MRTKTIVVILLVAILVIGVMILIATCSRSGRDSYQYLSVNVSEKQKVDKDLLQMLTQEFLEERARIALTKPSAQDDPSDNVVDLRREADLIKWSYRNVGDYDQNGEVGVSDITMVALHYGHTQQNGVWLDEVDEVIDGDEDGEIGISDITPIAINYLHAISGYSIEGAGVVDGEFSEIAIALLPAQKTDRRLVLDFPTPSGWDVPAYLRVVPITENDNKGSPSNTVYNSLVITGVDTTSVIAGTKTMIEAQTAGFIQITTDFYWDLGEADYYGYPPGQYNPCWFSVNDVPGTYPASVEVRDQSGFLDQFDFDLVVREGIWRNYDLPIDYSPYSNLLMEYIAGRNYIVYFDEDSSDINAVELVDGKWSEPILIAHVSALELELLDIGQGRQYPAIVYQVWNTDDNRALKYIESLDFKGTQWPSDAETIALGHCGKAKLESVKDYTNDVYMPSVAYVYYNEGHRSVLSFARSTDNSWQSFIIDDSTPLAPPSYNSLSLLYMNGQYMIAYTDFDYSTLKLVRGDGQNWDSVVIGTGRCPILQLGSDTSLENWPGGSKSRLIVTYLSEDMKQLLCSMSTDTSGSYWNAPIVINEVTDDVNYIQRYSLDCHIAGRPSVLYQNSDGELRYARSLNSAPWGESWGQPIAVASDAIDDPSISSYEGGPVAVYSSLVNNKFVPKIAYLQ